MASVFKRKRDRQRKNASWFIAYSDENGVRRTVKGCPDKAATEGIARKLETDAQERRRGVIDSKAESYRDHAARPLSDHLADWVNALEAKGATPKHVELFAGRARRVVALLLGAKLADIEPAKNAKRVDIPKAEAKLTEWVGTARLPDLTADRVQGALATLRYEGRALATCNHHRAAIKAFSRWCCDARRAKEDSLRGVTGFNVKEDRRHDRRTVSLDDLHRLIEATQSGPEVMGMTGPARALCYRLAVATGLRYSEIASIRPESFDWNAPSVTVAACYTKNGDPATLPIPNDLADDLAAFVATLPSGKQVFPLPDEKGAKMLRVDLEAAGIPYRDAAGLVFDFHSLRCQTATLADAAGVSPRVVQKMMRHSTLELTGRYTRPRAVDIEAAAGMLPSLKPESDNPESIALAATGTDDAVRYLPDSALTAQGQRAGDVSGRILSPTDMMADSDAQALMMGGTREKKASDASRRALTSSVVITGEATRTPDLRIMRPPL